MNGGFIRAPAGAVTAGRFIRAARRPEPPNLPSSRWVSTTDQQSARFTNNTGREGGAIYNYDSLTATDSVFAANHATQGDVVDQDWYAT